MEQFLTTTLLEAGAIAEKFFREGVSFRTKANFADFVTVADERVNEFLIHAISQAYPTHQIHSEELATDINPGAEYEWVIDPIDGTRNFALGIPMWCIMVSVQHRGETTHAGIYAPTLKTLYYAERGKGAFQNGVPIRVNTTSTVERALGIIVADSEGAYFERGLGAIEGFLRRGGWLINNSTMLVSAYLASGGIDFLFNNCGYDHDYLAPVFLCQEAGAVVTDGDGNPWQRGRKDLVIANPALHPEVLSLLGPRSTTTNE
jgi:myo-inositol-1(or 4)-monophosphatase